MGAIADESSSVLVNNTSINQQEEGANGGQPELEAPPQPEVPPQQEVVPQPEVPPQQEVVPLVQVPPQTFGMSSNSTS